MHVLGMQLVRWPWEHHLNSDCCLTLPWFAVPAVANSCVQTAPRSLSAQAVQCHPAQKGTSV